MNNRVTSDSANSVSLFPFLAVLLCTMGALLVLLVVLANRAGKRAVVEATQPAVASAGFQQELSKDAKEAANLASQLEAVHAYQEQLAELRQQADQRLQEEKQRLAHLEAHTRRLEHELALLSLAAEQLKATESNQVVDQGQAERELVRLQKLIEETEAELEELREEDQGKRSYAIVPYRGPNGTYRKPVYIECRKEGIILHPEGIRLKPSDFLATSWPGNPLAAALRATRDHVNAQAAQAGAPEPPDPYPMILIRPDGIRTYSLARAAITSWDASFGYEFIDSDWKLDFPEGPDPLLARKQEHAIMLARERLARLIRSAPSRFQGIGLAGTASGARGGTSGSNGYGEGNNAGEFAAGEQLGQSQAGGSGEGNGFAANQSTADSRSEEGEGAPGSETQYGAISGGEGGKGGDASATKEPAPPGQIAHSAPESIEGPEDTAGNGGLGERYSQAGGSAGGSSSAASGGQAAANGGGAGGAAAGGSPTSGGGSSADGPAPSIAETHGRNWAVQSGGRSSVPIRRPIQVVLRQNQIAVLPSRHNLAGDAATGKVISLDQPMSQVSSELVAALRTRIQEWGLAGSGLYWRPMLKLHVGPGAEQTSEQVIRLLKDSGVEVSLPETAQASTAGGQNAPR